MDGWDFHHGQGSDHLLKHHAAWIFVGMANKSWESVKKPAYGLRTMIFIDFLGHPSRDHHSSGPTNQHHWRYGFWTTSNPCYPPTAAHSIRSKWLCRSSSGDIRLWPFMVEVGRRGGCSPRRVSWVCCVGVCFFLFTKNMLPLVSPTRNGEFTADMFLLMASFQWGNPSFSIGGWGKQGLDIYKMGKSAAHIEDSCGPEMAIKTKHKTIE